MTKMLNLACIYFMSTCVEVFLGIATWTTFNNGWKIIMTILAIIGGFATQVMLVGKYVDKFGSEKFKETDIFDD